MEEKVLAWPKCLSWFLHDNSQKNPNEILANPILVLFWAISGS